MTTKRALHVHAADNVATLLADVIGGETILVMEKDGATTDLLILESVPFGHKTALKAITRGQDVIKYGESIGVATQDINAGQHVNVHNLDSKRGKA